MSTEDLAAWLTAIWDEQEKAAKFEAEYAEGYHATKVVEYQWVRFIRDIPGGMVWGTQFGPGAPSPTEVLARIAADRQILELHLGTHDCSEVRTGTYAADWPESASWGKPGGDWRHVATEHFEGDEACPTLRLLAVPHADRPGYQESWRPAQLP